MRTENPRKVAVLGSGALKIGEAGEFDYSGSQSLNALTEEHIPFLVVNPNIATLQTDTHDGRKVFFVPVTPEFVEPILESEGVDGLFLSFGGQSALNCGVALDDRGILKRLGIQVLGTPVDAIRHTEDRKLFAELMERCGVPVLKSHAVYSVEEARATAKELGYPLISRVAYTLGGKGGGIVRTPDDLESVCGRGLRISPVHQILLERYVGQFKQIEYEVIRDRGGDSLTVCNMENVLSMRVHTGDNIVVAPSQTLTDTEYQMLRAAALRAVAGAGIVGECNIQFALDPESEEYFAIEINARLSRSSALASKATGYPIAYVAAKLALGYRLSELKNRVTGKTTAFFEPALDYVVVKHPRWDLEKFPRADRQLGPTMKSVGESMGVGGSFREALLKAQRMVNPTTDVVAPETIRPREEILNDLRAPKPDILRTVMEAFAAGFSEEAVARETWIDPWFVRELGDLHRISEQLGRRPLSTLSKERMLEAKRSGLSDAGIAGILGESEEKVRRRRKALGVAPVTRMIDTLANEWPARTNYLYLTYWGDTDDVPPMAHGSILVLGAGPYRIGSSVEFDWSTMNLVEALREEGVSSVAVLNSNPETVSTDYDRSDRLYFDEISLERVRDIIEKERFKGLVTSVGSQLAQNLTPHLARHGVRILGTSSASIEAAEDRTAFSTIVEKEGIPQPPWRTFSRLEEARAFAQEVGYPVLVRPSFVLSGRAMRVIPGEADLERFLREAAEVSREHPVVLSKFIEGAMEIDLDAVSDGHRTLVAGILEHVENAGVHSGDAIMVLPPRLTPHHVQEKLIEIARRLGRKLRVRGPFNLQFLVRGEEAFVIEMNLRASRSLPFATKASGYPLHREVARAILGKPLSRDGMVLPPFGRWGVKAPQFSFFQVDRADPLLGVEMQSTGEVACFGPTFADAFVKAMVATGVKVVREGGEVFLSVGGPELKERILPGAIAMERLGFRISATEDTAEFLRARGVRAVRTLYKLMEPERQPNLKDALAAGEIDLVVNVASSFTQEKLERMLEDDYTLRRMSVELALPLFTSVETFLAYVEGLSWLREHPVSTEALGLASRTRSLNQPRSVALRTTPSTVRERTAALPGSPGADSEKGTSQATSMSTSPSGGASGTESARAPSSASRTD